MSFALSCFSSGFVGRAEKKRLRAGGMPPAVFSELSGPAAGNKREKAGGQGVGMVGWVGSAYLAVMPWGKEGWWSYCGSC